METHKIIQSFKTSISHPPSSTQMAKEQIFWSTGLMALACLLGWNRLLNSLAVHSTFIFALNCLGVVAACLMIRILYLNFRSPYALSITFYVIFGVLGLGCLVYATESAYSFMLK